MALDSRYVIAPSLQMYFVDKDSGLPLENGQVFFYQDQARTIPKDVFELVGGPFNYTYNVLPNPSLLSAVGTFQDNNGVDIIPYYYPFDADGNIELYYIEVYDSQGVLQFTREGWPNETSSGNTNDNSDITNFIPNGQFLLHNNIPASSTNNFIANEVSEDITIIAEGGWTFERGPSSTATDFVTFPSLGGPVEIPTGNPIYSVAIQTTIAGSDTRKDLCVKFPGVNTFASDTQEYNFYFEAESLTGGVINGCQIIVRKFFGTGGSPSATTETVIGPFSLSATWQSFNFTILFGTNTGKTIGMNNDDYVQICLRLPTNNIQFAQFTDFALTLGNATLTSFPPETEYQQTDESLAGSIPTPNPNGFQLYLPTILGPNGLMFDDSSIGSVEGLFVSNGSQTGNLLYCDGSQYLTADYSSLGIPYARLQAKLFNTISGAGHVIAVNGPLFGTGADFVDSYISTGLTTQLILSTNKLGSQTNPADTGGTGFIFNPSTNAGTTSLGYTAYSSDFGTVTAICNSAGLVTLGVSAGTSGLAPIDLKQPGIATGARYAWRVTALSAAALAAGSGSPGLYMDYSSTSVNYRIWFFVNGEVAPATGGRTLIQCNLVSTMSIYDVSYVMASVISACQTNTITVNGLPTAGSYFTFTANSTTYYVWYQVNGSGTAPNQPFSQLIKVILDGSETNAEVAEATQIAINSQFFAVPDLRGQFLRGNDPTDIVDLDGNYRYGRYFNTLAYLGTYQQDEYTKHHHQIGQTAAGTGASTGADVGVSYTVPAGGDETRPLNVAINWFMRY